MAAITLDAPAPITAPTRRPGLTPYALAPVLAVIAAKTALALTVITRYGWHRDELYYVASGDHPALGYSDFPPVTPMLARLSQLLYGDSLVGLRSFALLAGVGVIVLTALIARELGGGRYAQALAALAIGFSPMLLGSNAMFQTVSFDHLGWAAVLFVTVRLLRTGDPRLWPVLGLVAGAALTTKYTSVVLLGGLALGLLTTGAGRRLLGGPGPWVAGALAAAIVAPSLWWQASHGWPFVDFARGIEESTSSADFVGELLALAGPPFGVALLLVGGRRLLADRRWAPLAVASIAVPLLFLVTGGKSYYPAPLLVLLFAAGAVVIEGWGRRMRRGVPVALLVGTAVAAPFALPVLSTDRMVDLGLWEMRVDYAEELGWPELVEQVAAVHRRHPSAAILASNYGEAGAVDLFGPTHGLPPAASAHLSYRSWGPRRPEARTLVTIGYTQADLARWCSSVTPAGRVTNPWGIENEEHGQPIAVCHLRGTFAQAWPSIRS